MTSRLVPYEINVPKGGIAIVGRDPDASSERTGRPFAGVSGRVLEDAMTEAGLVRGRVNLLLVSRFRPPANKFEAHSRGRLEDEIRNLHRTLASLEPSIIVALGNEACHALIPEWPDGRDADGLTHRGNIFGATDIEARRGYVFDSPHGAAVVATVDPAYVARTWSPWRVLLSQDLQRAKRISSNGLVRPTRDVEIIGSDRDARRAVESLGRFRILGTDIETWRDTSLACIGFAGESGKAYVFPTRYLDRASELLGNQNLTTIWANGIYDLFVLKHREGVDFRARVEDAQILWHACYPEIAGAKEDKKKHRFTRKSLAFLASLATYDAWWKGDYDTEEEFYIYNGKDCCITYDVWEHVKKEADGLGAWDTYEHERRLMWPCVDMLQRGLNVDEALRRERVEALTRDIEASASKSLEVILPLLEREKDTLESLGVIHLFQETDPTCTCCGHGTKKQAACWSCAGFDRAPTKAMIVETYGEELTKGKSKAECEELLPVCHVCEGRPRETRWTFNANSDTQMRTILYDVLKLPKRFNDGSLTVNEAALKSLLGVLPT